MAAYLPDWEEREKMVVNPTRMVSVPGCRLVWKQRRVGGVAVDRSSTIGDAAPEHSHELGIGGQDATDSFARSGD